jgi:hypothetical protein
MQSETVVDVVRRANYNVVEASTGIYHDKRGEE